MSESVLVVGKFVFLGFLYLFFARVMRAAWVELKVTNAITDQDQFSNDINSRGDANATSRFGSNVADNSPDRPGNNSANHTHHRSGHGHVEISGIASGNKNRFKNRRSRASNYESDSAIPRGRSVPSGVAIVSDDAPGPHRIPLNDLLAGKEMTIGRGAGCAIHISDPLVSSVHARLFTTNSKIVVEDLGSTNGTILNGQPISAPTKVSVGDRINVGATTLEFVK